MHPYIDMHIQGYGDIDYYPLWIDQPVSNQYLSTGHVDANTDQVTDMI